MASSSLRGDGACCSSTRTCPGPGGAEFGCVELSLESSAVNERGCSCGEHSRLALPCGGFACTLLRLGRTLASRSVAKPADHHCRDERTASATRLDDSWTARW